MTRECTSTSRPVPDGYMVDHVGRLWPIGQVKEVIQQRDMLVRDLVTRARDLAAHTAATKRRFLDDMAAHIALAAEHLGVELSGDRGSLALTTFDGRLKIERAMSPRLTVSPEDILAAEEQVRTLVDALITDLESAGGGSGNPEGRGANAAALRAIVARAFRRNASGQIVLSRLLDFAAMQIDDPRWRTAQAIIRGAVAVDDTVTYWRAYERDDPAHRWRQIDLDFSRISPAPEAA